MGKVKQAVLWALLVLGVSLVVAGGVAAKQTAQLFWGEGCPHCEKVRLFLQDNQQNIKWNIVEKEIYHHPENRTLFLNAVRNCGLDIKKAGVPLLVVGEQCYLGDREIINVIQNQALREAKKPSRLPAKAGAKLTLPLVVSGALVDAINPCAFAVLILLLMTILAAGQRRRVIGAGLAFSGAIFLSYYAMGVGLYHLVVWAHLSLFLARFLGGLAIILGLLNLKDYFAYGAGGFVMEVPRRWRPRMKRLIRSATSPISAFIIGLAVSTFLLPCTSGPYIVITSWLAAREHYQQALAWLAVYNLVFISPMLAITVGVWRGLVPQQLEEKRQKSLRLLHLLAGLLLTFVGIATYLL